MESIINDNAETPVIPLATEKVKVKKTVKKKRITEFDKILAAYKRMSLSVDLIISGVVNVKDIYDSGANNVIDTYYEGRAIMDMIVEKHNKIGAKK